MKIRDEIAGKVKIEKDFRLGLRKRKEGEE